MMEREEGEETAGEVKEKENASPPPEPELGWDDDGEGDEESVDASEAEAVEMQARMEELLKDLGLFRRKVADDHSRFGVGKVPFGAVRVN